MKLLPINSIYRAHEGEGFHLGKPQVFVRLQGCAIGCINCDSKDTWDFTQGFQQTVSDIVYLIQKYRENDGINRVSITGGDPTHPKFEEGLNELVGELKKKNYFVNIEASGTRLPSILFDLVDYISFDVKTPSTGVRLQESLLNDFLKQYSHKGQIKSVIENRQDFDFVLELKNRLAQNYDNWILTPCYKTEEEFPEARFRTILEWNYEAKSIFRVIGQQHKWIFGSKEKQV
jgi:7-carboxy-7-deazaguanine synthase